MVNRKPQLLTHSRLAALRSCPRRHYYRYELGLSRIRSNDALRFGGAFHCGLEARNKRLDEAAAFEKATAGYAQVPCWADPTDWAVERETLSQLLAGHYWRYSADELQFVAVEQAFQIPLLNPGSGHASRLFELAGKIDAIVKLPDGRLAVLEYKTAGEDLAPDSDYWLRLRCDPQISFYVTAARAIGFDVSTVLYDVTRKPTNRVQKLEDYGFGKGYTYVYETFLTLLGDLDQHSRAGRHVILICHDCTNTVPNPDGEDWLRYEPRLLSPASGKSSIRLRVREWADHVLFVGYDVAVSEGKGKGRGTRTIWPAEMPHCMAKSRTLSGPLTLGKFDLNLWNQLLGETNHAA